MIFKSSRLADLYLYTEGLVQFNELNYRNCPIGSSTRKYTLSAFSRCIYKAGQIQCELEAISSPQLIHGALRWLNYKVIATGHKIKLKWHRVRVSVTEAVCLLSVKVFRIMELKLRQLCSLMKVGKQSMLQQCLEVRRLKIVLWLNLLHWFIFLTAFMISKRANAKTSNTEAGLCSHDLMWQMLTCSRVVEETILKR